MATAGSAEQPGGAAAAAAGRSRSGPGPGPGSGPGRGSGSSPPEDEAAKCAASAPARPGGSSPSGPSCLARRLSGSEERLRAKSDPDWSGGRPGRAPCEGRRELFVCPTLLPKSAEVSLAANMKLKPGDDRDELRKRSVCKEEPGSVRRVDEPGVLSDSENEEPPGRRSRHLSAFVRKTRTSSGFSGGPQRSRSCTDPVEERGGKLKVLTQLAMIDPVGSIRHSYTAGILLSSENSCSFLAPPITPDRRPAWRAVMMSSSATLGLPQQRAERSVSPESNDSISEELNHFKPIVCSPCTPPKRMPDGRLMEPAIVKSTPRNLTRRLQRATSYEASPAVLQKWRQIELDRQSLKVNSKGTLTSPVRDLRNTAKTRQGDGAASTNKRKLLFEPSTGDADNFQKQSVKIRVPAIRYSGGTTFRPSSDFESTVGAPDLHGGGAYFCRKRSFSPYTRKSEFQACKLVPKDSQSPRKEPDIHNQSTSRRGKKRVQKTKHLNSDRDPDLKRSRAAGQEDDGVLLRRLQQERQDRALAVKLQRRFDLEEQSGACRRSPDTYFLRSWMSSQNRRRRGLRRSRRINKMH